MFKIVAISGNATATYSYLDTQRKLWRDQITHLNQLKLYDGITARWVKGFPNTYPIRRGSFCALREPLPPKKWSPQ